MLEEARKLIKKEKIKTKILGVTLAGHRVGGEPHGLRFKQTWGIGMEKGQVSCESRVWVCVP